MRNKVLCFGELLLRISPDADGHWLTDHHPPFYLGGAEANVALALALWQTPVSYLTALPENFLSEQVTTFLTKKKVDVSNIVYQGERMGLYFLPKGKDLKNAGVIYDRNHSSFSQLTTGRIDWNKVFEDVCWFHFSAICPAINQQIADVCEEALVAAKSMGITVSLDLNYRAKLWQYGKQPVEVIPALAQYCDVVMGNVWAAEKMLGLAVDEALISNETKDTYLAQAEKTSLAIMERYPQCKVVANTFRFDYRLKGIRYYTALYKDGKMSVSNEYVADHIVDKVGSGDCYMAGLIYGFYNKWDAKKTVEFATAAAYEKLYVKNDSTNVGADEIIEFLKAYEK